MGWEDADEDFLKKNQNAPRPSEHPPVMGGKCQNVCFEKIPKNNTSVLRTESKETPDLDQHRTHPPVLSTCPLHTNSGCGKER